MSSSFKLAPKALEDLQEIWAYIALENHAPDAADELVLAIENACQRLAAKPFLGHRRKDLTPDPGVLFFAVRGYYLVIYRKNTAPLEIARILHGARHVADELGA